MFLARVVRPSWCGRTREVWLSGNRGGGLPGGVVWSGVTLTKRQLAGRQRVSQRTIPAPVVLLWFLVFPLCFPPCFVFPPSVLPSFHSFFLTPVFFCFFFVVVVGFDLLLFLVFPPLLPPFSFSPSSFFLPLFIPSS